MIIRISSLTKRLIMKKFLYIAFFLFSYSISLSQISLGGIPYSIENDLKTDIPEIVIDEPTNDEIENILHNQEKNGIIDPVGIMLSVNKNMKNSGIWEYLPDGGKLWRLRIRSPCALALNCHFEDLYLPPGSKLYLYDEFKTRIIGAFSDHNNNGNGWFSTEMIKDETITIEYYEPAKVIKNGQFTISQICYFFRDIDFIDQDTKNDKIHEFGDADNCQVNVNCSEGNNYQNEKRGVARVNVVIGSLSGWCTGSLVANATGDDTPYFLTADHCAYYNNSYASSQNLSQWVFYFNYEASSCSNPSTEPSSNTISGCELVSHGGCAGECGSDFYLVELSSTPPENYNVFYNGWNRNNTASSSGVSIHHPSGDIKKISTYTNSLVSTAWNNSYPNTHWQVRWSQTSNGHGVTEGGSSGSPIFNSNGLIVGSLTGGSSYCTATDQPDLYGKFSYHWESNGSSSTTRLKDWLDPNNSGTTTLSGYDPYGGSSSEPAYDVELSSIVSPTENDCSLSSVTPQITINNLGTATLTSINAYYQIDDQTAVSKTWSGSLDQNESANITFSQISIPDGSYTFSASVTIGDGNTDSDLSNNSKSAEITSGKEIQVKIKTDEYGSETTWTIKDENSNTIASGGPYQDGQINTYTTTHCLNDSCYTFTINDSYGDGICCYYGNGNYEVKNLTDNAIIASGGNFSYQESTDFCISESCPDDLTVQNITIGNGESNSFQAKTNVSIAGSNTSFSASSGSEVYSSAGSSIKLLPGTHIYNGSSSKFIIDDGNCSSPSPITPPDDLLNTANEFYDNSDINDLNLRIFPNPNEGIFNVVIDESLDKKAKLEIFNLLGNKVYESYFILSERVTLDQYRDRVLFIKVTYKDSYSIRKVIIEK